MNALHLSKLVAASGIVLGCSLAACQSGPSSQELEKVEAISDEDISASLSEAAGISEAQQFASVCNGTGVDAAPTYEQSPDKVHPIYAFYRTDESSDY